MTVDDRLRLVEEQLSRVQAASIDPVDWPDLYTWAFYALENCVVAAAEHLGLPWERSHPRKAELARRLHDHHGLPDIETLLIDLNVLRQNAAYGESRASSNYDAEDIATWVEEYVEAVQRLAGKP